MASLAKKADSGWNNKHALLVLVSVAIIIAIIAGYYFKGKTNFSYSVSRQTLATGDSLFSKQCKSCHSIREDGIGPRLGGVTQILSEEELVSFIQNPSNVMEAGNKRAKSLYRKYKQVMPSFDFIKPKDIHSILAYIDNESRIATIEPLRVDTTITETTKERYAPAVIKSGLVIELDDYIKVPRADTNPPDKGIATLRAYPSGDGSVFVSDQMGVIFRIVNSQIDTFLNLRSSVPDFIFTPGIGTGLGSFAFHPDYVRNGLIYTSYTEEFIGKPADFQFADTFKAGLQWVLAEWKINSSKARKFSGTRRELLRINTPTTAHGVQEISFAPTQNKRDPDYGKLFLSIGDGGSNNIKRPDLVHNKQSLLGTVLRIDPLGTDSRNKQYGIPRDNPFVNDPDPSVRREIWAYGFRNPHHMSWESNNKRRMFVADIGESNVEEINVIEKGKDYGWPVREGNYGIATKVDLKKVFKINPAELSLYHAPFAQYDHTDGNAVSGGYVYEGTLKALKNKYLFGDIVNGKLFYVSVGSNLADSTVHEMFLIKDSQLTSLQQLNETKRVHLRLGYDPFKNELFLMTKNGMIRKVTKASFKQ